jgi:hypothetical protein
MAASKDQTQWIMHSIRAARYLLCIPSYIILFLSRHKRTNDIHFILYYMVKILLKPSANS